jgi:hypothetical protein
MKHMFLDTNDVVASDAGSHPYHLRLGMPATFRVKEVREKIKELVLQSIKFDVDQKLQCQVLQSDQPGWKSGVLQIKIEVTFIDDAPVQDIPKETLDISESLEQLRALDVTTKE